MQNIRAILLLLLICLAPSQGRGQDTLLLGQDKEQFALLGHALFKAAKKDAPFGEVQNDYGWFRKVELKEFRANSDFWLKLNLKHTGIDTSWYFLKTACCYHFDVYLSKNNLLYQRQRIQEKVFDHAGSDLSYKKMVPLRLPPGEVLSVIVKFQNISGTGSNVPFSSTNTKNWGFPEIEIYSQLEFIKNTQSTLLRELPFIQIVTLFQGAVGFSMVFFLFLYFKNRQKIYLFYSAYLVCFLVYALLLTRPYLPGGSLIAPLGWLKQPLQEGFNWLGIAMYIFFSASLLEMKRQAPVGYKRLKLLAFSIIVYSLLVSIWIPISGNPQHLKLLFIISRTIGLTLNLVILVWIYQKFNSPLKNYLLIGNGFIFISGTIASLITLTADSMQLREWGIGNSEAILIYLIGIILEVVTFSFALGYRIKINEEERDKSKEAYIKQLTLNQDLIQQTNIDLEKKLQDHTIRLTEQFNALEKEREEKIKSSFEKDLAYAQIQALHSQMNPHFLFNALNSIELAIQKGKKNEAVEYLSKFTRLLRLILQHTRSEKISLREELESVRLYLDLESWRFGEGFRYNIQIDETIDPENVLIPPLLLQPFVENAIWHGLMHSEKKEKLLSIKVFNESGCLGFFIEDNGIGMKRSHIYNQTNAKTRKSLGISLVNDRVTLFNKHSHQQLEFQHIEKTDGKTIDGTIVRICLKNRDHDQRRIN